jgi:hypothetical protein
MEGMGSEIGIEGMRFEIGDIEGMGSEIEIEGVGSEIENVRHRI